MDTEKGAIVSEKPRHQTPHWWRLIFFYKLLFCNNFNDTLNCHPFFSFKCEAVVLYIILFEVAREFSRFFKMARRSKVVGPSWSTLFWYSSILWKMTNVSIFSYKCFCNWCSYFSDGLNKLGCWADKGTRAIPTLEGTTKVLDGDPRARVRAIMKCAQAAEAIGADVFAVQVWNVYFESCKDNIWKVRQRGVFEGTTVMNLCSLYVWQSNL